MTRARILPRTAALTLALLLAGCSGGGARTPATHGSGSDAAAVAARDDARADSMIAARRAPGTPDRAATAEVLGSLASWADGWRRRDPSFAPESLAWQPVRRLAGDPGMKLSATFMDTLAHGAFGFVYAPDGTMAVDPQFRRFFEDETGRFSIQADPMVTVFHFPSRRRLVLDTGSAADGDVWSDVAWTGARTLVVGGSVTLGSRVAPAARIYDLAGMTCREGVAPALAAPAAR